MIIKCASVFCILLELRAPFCLLSDHFLGKKKTRCAPRDRIYCQRLSLSRQLPQRRLIYLQALQRKTGKLICLEKKATSDISGFHATAPSTLKTRIRKMLVFEAQDLRSFEMSFPPPPPPPPALATLVL